MELVTLPELIIEPPSEYNGWHWVWAVCQPDQNWGEWTSGTAHTRDAAISAGYRSLATVTQYLVTNGYFEYPINE